MTTLLKTVPFALILSSSAAFAENGLDYENVITCRANNTEVRFDRYGTMGNDGLWRTRDQVVVNGAFSAALFEVGFGPTKSSSVQNEFIIDRLESAHWSEGPYGNGTVLRVYRDGMAGEGTKVSLNGDQSAITIEWQDLKVSWQGFVCSVQP
jgi:hypothetical protein